MKNSTKLILVIDDEPDILEMVGFALRAEGFEVVSASDGLEGLEKLKTIKPDCIVLDMNMPRMNGLEFYEAIKNNDGKSPYPIVSFTARALIDDVYQGLDIEAFITKPFSMDVLVKTINLAINAKGM